MNKGAQLSDIQLRTTLQPGDIGYITYLHGIHYKAEYSYGVAFEAYVAAGLAEFYRHYDPQKDGVWICEYKSRIVGFLILMHRENNAAQLRFFIIVPDFRGIGMGKMLMQLFMAHIKEKGYREAYLWTTNEQDTAAAIYKRLGFTLVEEKYSEAFGKGLTEQKYSLMILPGIS